MIVIKLWGGTCNQLFQLAFGYVMGRLHDETPYFDTEFFQHQPKNLGQRKIITKNEFPNLFDISTYSRSPLISVIENRYISFPFRHVTGLKLSFGNTYLFMEKLTKFYSKIPYKKGGVNYYDGYWQSEDYFINYENEIKNFFTPSSEILDCVQKWRSSFGSKNLVAIHIRRGDYVENHNIISRYSALCNEEYYQKCIDYMTTILKEPIFCFFSDDIEWCKEKFKDNQNVFFVDNRCSNSDLVDLFSISACNHGIMSLSTFSWWGNWLRTQNKDSIVICPSGEKFNERYIPKEWIEYKEI